MFVKDQLGHAKLDQSLTYAKLTGTALERELGRIGRSFGEIVANRGQIAANRLTEKGQ